MSRHSSRILLCAVVLVASLVTALPAAAGPAHRAPALSGSLWSVFCNWAASVWSHIAPSEGDPDRGILIDPNGSPGR
jgi:hypothetical protein